MVHNTSRDRRKRLNKETVTPFDTMINAENHSAQRSAAMPLLNKTATDFTDTLSGFAPIRRDNSPASPSRYVPAVSARVQSWARRKAKKERKKLQEGVLWLRGSSHLSPSFFWRLEGHWIGRAGGDVSSESRDAELE